MTFFSDPKLDSLRTLILNLSLNEYIQAFFARENESNLEEQLLKARAYRTQNSSTVTYFIQSHIKAQSSNIAYVFAPYVFANLNRSCIYTTPATAPVLDILKADNLVEYNSDSRIKHALNALHMYIYLSPQNESEVDFFYCNLFKALCCNDVSTIFLITTLKIDEEKLQIIAAYLKVHIFVIDPQINQQDIHAELIDMGHLLFKNKDQFHTELCHLFACNNAKLLQKMDCLTLLQSTALVEDMFYSEHIFERMSVYTEYVQTQAQNQKKYNLVL